MYLRPEKNSQKGFYMYINFTDLHLEDNLLRHFEWEAQWSLITNKLLKFAERSTFMKLIISSFSYYKLRK